MRKYKEVNFSKVRTDYKQNSNAGQGVVGAIALPTAIAGGVGLGEGVKVAKKFAGKQLTKPLTGVGDTILTSGKLLGGTPLLAGKATLKGAGRFLTASPTRTAALMATGAGIGVANSILTNKNLKRNYIIRNDNIGRLQGSYRTPLQGGKYYVTFEDSRTGTAKVIAGANSRAEARELLITNNLVTSDKNIEVKVHIGKALANLYPRQFYAV